ncbi:hypothetical protein NQ318_017574 [Aromia moschata]|uniref:Strictosidine synthase conserved region domain-containing protein n=1 Tax=Aromia moschata TaxID=1265417 RepID=A0AAV8Z095_9CUCU|nr:hypothetical protein NQ318_017574 [Aromia moschata]
MFDLFADPTGRLIHFDAKTGKNTVLMDKLHFANGVALSEDEEFVIVAETARNRIHRYYLKGPKRGTRDIFADGLPGMPDNFKADGKGGFFVPLVIAVDADHPSPHQAVGTFPLLRKLIARVFGLVQLGFELINKVYPCEFAQKGMHFVGHFHSSGSFFFPKRTTLLHLDRNGNIVDSLHALNQRLACICDVQIFEDTLYLGSPFNDYIARVPLSKIGWQHLSPEKKKCKVPVGQTAKTQPPSSTTPPTTTPPPTTTRPPTTAPPKPQTPQLHNNRPLHLLLNHSLLHHLQNNKLLHHHQSNKPLHLQNNKPLQHLQNNKPRLLHHQSNKPPFTFKTTNTSTTSKTTNHSSSTTKATNPSTISKTTNPSTISKTTNCPTSTTTDPSTS